MKNFLAKLFLFLLLVFCFISFKKEERQSSFFTFAVSEEELQNKIDEYARILEELGNQEKTLNGQIGLMETREKITRTKITQSQVKIKVLEGEVATLSARIITLNNSLDYYSKVFLSRINLAYKTGLNDPIGLFFSSKGFNNLLLRFKYLEVIQLHDRELLLSMEETKVNYDEQKRLKEKMQKDLEVLKKQLEAEKTMLLSQLADRKKLLKETQGKETEYQKLIAATRAELEAIQQITAGQGEEKEVGKVGQGQRIASIIYGVSPCSTGTHLHFEIRDNNEHRNPLLYLRKINLVDNSGGDPMNASGSWEWPLNESVKFNQGYGGNTSSIRSRIVWYSFHTGIDLGSDDRVVKAVKPGTLYRGSAACGSGVLRYVRVHHDEGNIDTYFLHVNY